MQNFLKSWNKPENMTKMWNFDGITVPVNLPRRLEREIPWGEIPPNTEIPFIIIILGIFRRQKNLENLTINFLKKKHFSIELQWLILILLKEHYLQFFKTHPLVPITRQKKT